MTIHDTSFKITSMLVQNGLLVLGRAKNLASRSPLPTAGRLNAKPVILSCTDIDCSALVESNMASLFFEDAYFNDQESVDPSVHLQSSAFSSKPVAMLVQGRHHSSGADSHMLSGSDGALVTVF